MTNKLTLSDCMKYPNAKVKKISDAEITGTYKNTVIYENIITFVVKYPMLDEMEYEITNCKLILRDITQLTNEEKKYILYNFIYDLFKGGTKIKDIIWESFDGILGICENKVGLINYLREKNIMIEPEDWFAIGKAVKE